MGPSHSQTPSIGALAFVRPGFEVLCSGNLGTSILVYVDCIWFVLDIAPVVQFVPVACRSLNECLGGLGRREIMPAVVGSAVVPHIRIFVTGCDSSMGRSIPEWGTPYRDSPPVTNRIGLFASGGTPFKNTFLFVNGVPQLGIVSFAYAGAAEAEKAKTAVKPLHRPPFSIVFLMLTLCRS
jgi:hypothetical protein